MPAPLNYVTYNIPEAECTVRVPVVARSFSWCEWAARSCYPNLEPCFQGGYHTTELTSSVMHGLLVCARSGGNTDVFASAVASCFAATTSDVGSNVNALCQLALVLCDTRMGFYYARVAYVVARHNYALPQSEAEKILRNVRDSAKLKEKTWKSKTVKLFLIVDQLTPWLDRATRMHLEYCRPLEDTDSGELLLEGVDFSDERIIQSLCAVMLTPLTCPSLQRFTILPPLPWDSDVYHPHPLQWMALQAFFQRSVLSDVVVRSVRLPPVLLDRDRAYAKALAGAGGSPFLACVFYGADTDTDASLVFRDGINWTPSVPTYDSAEGILNHDALCLGIGVRRNCWRHLEEAWRKLPGICERVDAYCTLSMISLQNPSQVILGTSAVIEFFHCVATVAPGCLSLQSPDTIFVRDFFLYAILQRWLARKHADLTFCASAPFTPIRTTWFSWSPELLTSYTDPGVLFVVVVYDPAVDAHAIEESFSKGGKRYRVVGRAPRDPRLNGSGRHIFRHQLNLVPKELTKHRDGIWLSILRSAHLTQLWIVDMPAYPSDALLFARCSAYRYSVGYQDTCLFTAVPMCPLHNIWKYETRCIAPP